MPYKQYRLNYYQSDDWDDILRKYESILKEANQFGDEVIVCQSLDAIPSSLGHNKENEIYLAFFENQDFFIPQMEVSYL